MQHVLSSLPYMRTYYRYELVKNRKKKLYLNRIRSMYFCNTWIRSNFSHSSNRRIRVRYHLKFLIQHLNIHYSITFFVISLSIRFLQGVGDSMVATACKSILYYYNIQRTQSYLLSSPMTEKEESDIAKLQLDLVSFLDLSSVNLSITQLSMLVLSTHLLVS